MWSRPPKNDAPATALPSLEKGRAFLRAQTALLSEKPGVYRMLDSTKAVLYVGKAKNLKKRVLAYTNPDKLPLRIQRMVARVQGLEIVETHTESEALLLEAALIKRHKPPYNVLLRDDKSFPYIVITQDHAFPQALKHRGEKNVPGAYFGPFASGAAVTQALEHLQRTFGLRTCANAFFATRTRPCLHYHIKRCAGPCVGKITQSAYAQNVAHARAFLSGKTGTLKDEIATQMQTASDALEFERAAALRNRLSALAAVQPSQGVDASGLDDADVIALSRQGKTSAIQLFMFRSGRHHGARVYFPAHDADISDGEIVAAFLGQFYADKDVPDCILLSDAPDDLAGIARALAEKKGGAVELKTPLQGNKKRLVDAARANAAQELARALTQGDARAKNLARIADLFKLGKPPLRIEVYDNSHTSGTNAVGAMIAAGPEGFLKKTYRKFTIKTAPGDDDFAMMKEVLRRRFSRLKTETQDGLRPDLVLLDGGAGQLAQARAVLDELGIRDIALVGIAKGPERNAGKERFFMLDQAPFSLPADEPALFYLQTLRDEAHRFAIGTHRSARTRAMTGSSLDSIPGIGPKRKKALLHAFGSAKAVSAAGIAELARTEGVNEALARKIYAFYHDTR